MSEHKLPLRHFPHATASEPQTAESRYWKKFRTRAVQSYNGMPTHIEFHSAHPYDFAVTASTRVHIYESEFVRQRKQITRFKDVAYCGTFREDGKLAAAGGELGLVQVFDLGSRAVLRQMRGHQRACHVTKFVQGGQALCSGGDDAQVFCWDIATGDKLSQLSGHTDYIRCGVQSLQSPHLFVSGSYDHTVRIWDTRLSSSSAERSNSSDAEVDACVFKLDHGAPVEDLCFLSGGSILVTAGGNNLKLWDVLSGCKLLTTLSHHAKTITSVTASPTRLLSASLDQHVKVYDLNTYKPLHSMRYPAPILCMGFHEPPALTTTATTATAAAATTFDSSTVISPLLVVGLTSNQVYIRQRKQGELDTIVPVAKTAQTFLPPSIRPDLEQLSNKKPVNPGTLRFFLRGIHSTAGTDDYRVDYKRKKRLAPYEELMKKFRYADALDAVLEQGNPLIVVSMFHELHVVRGVLKTAVQGRSEPGLILLLGFLIKYVNEPRFSSLLIDVTRVVFDSYISVLGTSVTVDQLYVKLHARMKEELEFQKELLTLQGQLELVLSSSLHSSHSASNLLPNT